MFKLKKMKYDIIKLIGKLFLISFFVLLIVSPDSYLCDPLVEHWDVSWFFTCGKAWMNGMTPYVDFADSKGPLLWLIYGIGYLITPHSYIGIFWMSVLLYTGVFYFIYRIAFIFFKDNSLSLIIVLMMAASYFCMFYYNETRAEDWCQLFLAASFYRICMLLYTEDGKSNKNINMTCFILGISLAGTMMIKYNITIMLGISVIYVLFVLIRDKRNILSFFIFIISGMAIILLPFTLYMLTQADFGTFIQEYFINTLHTQDDHNNLSQYIQEWLFLVWDTHFIILFIICIIGSVLMSKQVKKDKWFFLISFLGFYAIAIHNCNTIVHYYLCICLFFPIWFCIAMTMRIKEQKVIKLVTTIILCFTLLGNYITFGYIDGNRWFKDTKMRQDRYTMAWYMSQVNKPTIIYYKSSDIGLGILSGGLPGTRYWAYQGGASEAMAQQQKKAVEKCTADFIYTNNHEKSLFENDSVICASGYTEIYHGSLGKNDYKFYTKHQLLPPPNDFHVGRLDILFRKNVFNH